MEQISLQSVEGMQSSGYESVELLIKGFQAEQVSGFLRSDDESRG